MGGQPCPCGAVGSGRPWGLATREYRALCLGAAAREGPLLEESTLLEQARAGDVAAYEELVRRYQDIALRTAYLITGGGAEAEDPTQEALVKAYHALGRFKPGAPFRPWLLRIVANEARNRRVAEGRRAALALHVAAAPAQPGPPTPEALALRGECHEALLRALAALRPQDRLIIAYRYFLDLSEEEMATAPWAAPPRYGQVASLPRPHATARQPGRPGRPPG